MQLVVMRNATASLSLHVTDDGPGIAGEDAAQLFEPFFTNVARGTGLGLYIARELAAANGAVLESIAPDARDPVVTEMTGLSGADFLLVFAAPVRERAKVEPRLGAAGAAALSTDLPH